MATGHRPLQQLTAASGGAACSASSELHNCCPLEMWRLTGCCRQANRAAAVAAVVAVAAAEAAAGAASAGSAAVRGSVATAGREQDFAVGLLSGIAPAAGP